MSETPEIHDDGAPSDAKLVIEAARSNNVDLLGQIIERYPTAEAAAKVLNEAKTVMGNYAYHEAALRGNWDVIDMLLDQDGFECDPICHRDGDTPLHSAVRWINTLPKAQWDAASGLIEMMLDAGSEPKIRNKANLKAVELVDPSNKDLKKIIDDAEYANMHRDDFIDHDDVAGGVEEDDDPTGSNSDSDFDIEKKPNEK